MNRNNRAHFTCPICGKRFTLPRSEARKRIRNTGAAGFSCSRACGQEIRRIRKAQRISAGATS